MKTPRIIKRIFPKFTWDMLNSEKVIYLTFDDGPTPEITPWVLSELEKHHAKATFFCIGKNIVQYPELLKQTINSGHTIGNHTHNHLNSLKSKKKAYTNNVDTAQKVIDKYFKKKGEKLFRPPYGRIKHGTAKKLFKNKYQIVMWDVLSADFDLNITEETCLKNVLNNAESGSIIVFHDSIKASKNLKYCLPKVLTHFSNKGYKFKAL